MRFSRLSWVGSKTPLNGSKMKSRILTFSKSLFSNDAFFSNQSFSLSLGFILSLKSFIGKASYKSYSKLRKPLLELKDVLCEIELGKPIKDGKKATVIRRYTLFELKEAKRKSKIVDKDPVHAKKLSEILESRSFVYGNEPECKPYWNVARTGRVTSHKPNVQGDNKKDRIESLRQGLQNDQVLLDLDIQQAEPSIIQQVLKYKFDSDPYNLLAKINGVDRQEAKSSLNMLAYANSAVKILQYWHPEAQELFKAYAESLDEYKAKLWEYGKPHGRQRRFADTLGGSRVYATKGDKNHRGRSMNWHIQGTVADTGKCSLKLQERMARCYLSIPRYLLRGVGQQWARSRWAMMCLTKTGYLVELRTSVI